MTKKGKKKDKKEEISETVQELQNGNEFTEVEIKKKKRVKENADENSCQTDMLNNGKDENTKKKRKRKNKQDQDCMEDANGKMTYETGEQLDCDEVTEEPFRPKKKKKRQDSNDCDEVIEEPSRPKKKKKKQDSNDCDEAIEEPSRPKKKKKKQDSHDCDEVIDEPSRPKKKKKRQDSNDCDEVIEEPSRPKKKKKRQDSNDCDEVIEEPSRPKKKKKEKNLNDCDDDKQVIDSNEKSVQDSSDAEICCKKKKKKRNKSEKVNFDKTNSTHENGLEPECNEKKRKKSLVEESADQNCDIQIEKKKKRKDNDAEGTQVNDTGKSESIRESMNAKAKESWNSPVFESDKRQEKFQRLLGGKKWSDQKKSPCSSSSSDSIKTKPEIEKDEKEIDYPNKNNSEEKGCSSPTLSAGQWKGMMFENAERQNKFLRLLGGAKSTTDKKKTLFSSGSSGPRKGLYGSLSSKFNTSLSDNGLTTGKNNAMDLQTAVSLNQNLEDDYNRALSKKLGGLGSAGIGFVKDPAEGKKFHIDSNATKSMKFADDDE